MDTDRLKKILDTRCREICHRYGLPYHSNMLEDYLGTSISDVKRYLETQFSDMKGSEVQYNWNNYGKSWEIDHFNPIGEAETVDQVKERLYYINLCPLSRWENRQKGRHLGAKTKNYKPWVTRQIY